MFVKKSQEKFKQYQDPTREFTNRSLQIAQWYVGHKILLRKILIIALSVWSVITISIGLIVWGKYLIIDMVRDDQHIASIANTYVSQSAIQNQAPKNLIISQVRTFGASPDRYDFIAHVRNENSRWAVKITYMFTYSGGQTEKGTGIILPGADRIITVLGHDLSRQPTGVDFSIIDAQWKRISAHVLPDPAAYISDRIQFEVRDLVFIPANKSTDTGTNSIQFDVVNMSLYSYWQADFTVRFVNNGQTSGLAPLTITQFKSKETRSIELTSLADNLHVDMVVLEPLINVFDSTVYMPL
ncbi:MAG: hypothetical protein HYV41_01415 [Candidatus Magasanikbacteria bacterium]|nr:hypothetical protein [Candidatus Magasanikbacteria bacterium]